MRLCSECATIMGMVRALGCILATLACGCLIPNPAYLGESGAGSGSGTGAEETAGAGQESTDPGSGSTSVDTAGGDGTTVADAMATSDTVATSGAESDSEGGGTVDLGEGCPDDDSLVACFLFDVDDPEAVTDESAYANPVSVEGGGLVDSPWLRAFAFDAETQLEVECDACAGGEQFSFEAWLWVDEAPAGRSGIVDHNGLLGAFVTDGLELRCNSQGGAAEGGSIALQTWVHVACVADGETLLAYVDGAAVAERPINPLTAAGQATLVLGNDSPSFGEPLLGALDRVRVWDMALSAEQVAQAAMP